MEISSVFTDRTQAIKNQLGQLEESHPKDDGRPFYFSFSECMYLMVICDMWKNAQQGTEEEDKLEQEMVNIIINKYTKFQSIHIPTNKKST